MPRLLVFALLATALAAPAQDLSPDLRQKVDAAARAVLESTGVPSASLGIVQNGHIAYTAAYGKARLTPDLPAQPTMRYAVGSITKQFTATAILLLAEDGKLTLDDPVAKYFPNLTQASAITIRNLLTHTSGYQDYAPQDYTIPAWTHPTQPLAIVNAYAGKPLDFPPGTQWQYSNTNFVLAGLIIEKASGMPFWQFLQQRILTPLGLRETIDLDTQRDQVQVTGYFRNALGPLRPSPLEAPGWYFADGNLAMPVADLLTWDLALIQHKLLKPASYTAFETEMKLSDGRSTHYGLGVSVGTRNGHREITHSGEVSGFVAANDVYPDDGLAIAVFTNQEASSAAGTIARKLGDLLLTSPPAASHPPSEAAAETQARTILTALQHGTLDRTLFTEDARFYFTPQTIADFATSLAPLGAVTQLTQTSTSLRGGMVFRAFRVTFATRQLTLTTFTTPEGKLEQFLIEPAT